MSLLARFKVTVCSMLGLAVMVSQVSGQAESASDDPITLPYYQEATLTPIWIDRGDPDYQKIHRVGTFRCVNQEGEPVEEESYRGSIRVVGFFFTSCSGICATMTKNLKQVQKTFEDVPDVRLLSFSVLPEVDTVSVLKDYAKTYGIDSDKWHLLRGNRETVYQLATDSYFAEAKVAGQDPSDGVVHSEKILLIDPEGRIRGAYNGTLAFDMRRIIDDINLLRKELEPKPGRKRAGEDL